MRTARSLTVSCHILCMSPSATTHTPCNHTHCPLETMHAPLQPHSPPPATTHAPLQPCMPPSATTHPPATTHTHPQQPCMPPSNHACPPTTMYTPQQPCMPPTTMHAPLQPHMPPNHACPSPPPPVNKMTNRYKNITLPQISFAGGNNSWTFSWYWQMIDVDLFVPADGRW